MCIIFINTAPSHGLSLILAFNRDEIKSRATTPLHFWETQKLYAGKDVSPDGLPNGTWLGISKHGKFGALLNVFNMKSKVYDVAGHSRGQLVPDYITGKQNPEDYVGFLKKSKKKYKSFNLVMGEFLEEKFRISLYDYYHNELMVIPNDISCYSNLPPSHVNPRTDFGLDLFLKVIDEFNQKEFGDPQTRNCYIIDSLFNMLKDTHEIANTTGLPGSFKHIFNTGYSSFGLSEAGTVSSTILLIDKDKNCLLIEKTNFSSDDKDNIKEYQWSF